MTLEQLRVLVMVVKTGSFHAASIELDRSRPAVSIAIKNLEEELGLSLFTRDKYRPELTDEGRVFYEKVQHVLEHMQGLKVLGQQLALGYEPEITLAVNALAPMLSAMTILHFFQDDYSFTRMNLDVEYGDVAMRRLLDGEADLALTIYQSQDVRLEFIPWGQVTLLPVAAPSFPLSQLSQSQGDIQHTEILEHVQIVVCAQNQEHIPEESLQSGRRWQVSDYATKKELLVASLGWGMMPNHLIEAELESGTLVPLRFKNAETYQRKLGLFRRVDRPMGPVLQKVWEFVGKAQGELNKAKPS